MNTTLKLTLASIKMFLRSRQALFFTLFSPLIIMVIFGLIGFDKPQTYDVGLVSGNFEPATQQMIDKLKDISVLKIHEDTYDNEIQQLKDGNRVLVLTVPNDLLSMAPDQSSAAPKVINIDINESQQGQAQAVISILNQFLDKANLAAVNAPTLFSLKQEIVNSKNLKYIDFLLPGLIAMSVMQMSVFSVAFVFVQYKEKGVLKRLLATPMWPAQFVAANVLTRMLVSIAQTAIFILVGVFVLKAHIIGSYWLIFLCVIPGTLMFLGLGFTISGISKTVDSVPAIANLIAFPMLFLGGTFFPISNMPHWLQVFAKVLPLTFFSTALRDITTKGATLGDIKFDLLAMFNWAFILILLAIVTFGFQEKENA